MINKDRIVPIQKTDYLTMILTICNLISMIADVETHVEPLKADDTIGNFKITETPEAPLLADQPIRTLDFASDVGSANVLFVPAYDYKGITINGVAVTPREGSATVNPDGITLYGATKVGNEIVVYAISPDVDSESKSGGGDEGGDDEGGGGGE